MFRLCFFTGAKLIQKNMGMFSRLRASRAERKAHRLEMKAKRRASRKHRKEHRLENRDKRHQMRADNREKRKESRMARRMAKHGYNDVTPEQEQQAEELQPYNQAMNDSLKEQGVEVENPDDNVEVGAKYAQLNPDIANPLDDETYNDAFVNTEDDYESHFEHAERKGLAKSALTFGLGAITGGIQAYKDSLAQKQADGTPLTPHETEMLKAGQRDGKNDGVDIKKIGIAIAVVILILVVLRAKKVI